MKRKPRCRKCGNKNFRRSGLVPTNPAMSYRHQKGGTTQSSKGWKGPAAKGDGYHKEAVARLFNRKYCCTNCGHQMKIKK